MRVLRALRGLVHTDAHASANNSTLPRCALFTATAAAGSLAAATVLGALAVGLSLTASPAAAASSSVLVLPGTATPGEQISVFGTACPSFTGTASSKAFSAPIHLVGLSNTTGGVGSIAQTAAPGTYSVTVSCGNKTFTGSVTVVAFASPTASATASASASATSAASASASATATASATSTPSGGAATGDGSSIGGSSGGLAAGAATLAAGALLGAVEVRRRRSAVRR